MMDATMRVRPWVRTAATHGFGLWLTAIAIAACEEQDDAARDADEPAGSDDTPADGSDTGQAAEPTECDAELGGGACANLDPCEAFDCGGKTAPFSHYGCRRVACTADSDCGGGERCFAVALDTACRAAATCEDDDGACTCGSGALACAGALDAHCLPTGFYPASGDCDVEGLDCDELTARGVAVSEARAERDALGHTELATALAACAETIEAASAACAGQVAP